MSPQSLSGPPCLFTVTSPDRSRRNRLDVLIETGYSTFRGPPFIPMRTNDDFVAVSLVLARQKLTCSSIHSNSVALALPDAFIFKPGSTC